jgi:hypothetical protein
MGLCVNDIVLLYKPNCDNCFINQFTRLYLTPHRRLGFGFVCVCWQQSSQLLSLCLQRVCEMVSISCGAIVRAQMEVNVMYWHVDS